jgi:hypothetical protein
VDRVKGKEEYDEGAGTARREEKYTPVGLQVSWVFKGTVSIHAMNL